MLLGLYLALASCFLADLPASDIPEAFSNALATATSFEAAEQTKAIAYAYYLELFGDQHAESLPIFPQLLAEFDFAASDLQPPSKPPTKGRMLTHIDAISGEMLQQKLHAFLATAGADIAQGFSVADRHARLLARVGLASFYQSPICVQCSRCALF